MISAINSISGSFMPLVVTAGVPIRMPLATFGPFVEGDHVPVEHDPASLQALLRFYSGDALVGEVDKEEMVVRPPGHDPVPRLLHTGREMAGILDDLLLVGFELRRHRVLEGHCLCCDDMHERAALDAGEDHRVDQSWRALCRRGSSPPRGPRSVLCVVPVTKWATPTGLGWRPVATAPAMWAMSTRR